MKEADGPGNCNTNISQKIYATEEYYTKTMFQNLKKKISQWSLYNENNIQYFLTGVNSNNDKRTSAETTHKVQREFKDVFNDISFFNGAFSLQVKPDSKPY